MVTPERLAALFRDYHAPLVRFLARRLGDRDQAEELAQETFMRAMKQDVIASERSWLFAVASNLVRDDARRESRQRARDERLRNDVADVADPITLDVEREEERALARSALAALADRDRDALLMREEGLGYPEIAEALGIAVGSVGTTLSRARRRLVEAYEALQQEGATRDGVAEQGSGTGRDTR